MKISRKNRMRILKAVEFARNLFLVLFFICLALAFISMDSESLVFPMACLGIGVVCFGVSCVFDRLLFETA